MIRDAACSDVVAVARILSDFVDDTPWLPRVHSRAEDLRHIEDLIARGWVRVIAAPDVRGFAARDRTRLHALYVRADAQGQGLGKAMLDDAKTRADRIALWTFQRNLRAQRFYCREGFRELRRTDGADNDEGLADIEYEWARRTT